jgi:hypothetical protein
MRGDPVVLLQTVPYSSFENHWPGADQMAITVISRPAAAITVKKPTLK